MGQRRLRDVLPFRRAGKASAFGYCSKISELVDFHDNSFRLESSVYRPRLQNAHPDLDFILRADPFLRIFGRQNGITYCLPHDAIGVSGQNFMTPQIPNAAHHAQILGFEWIPQLMPVEISGDHRQSLLAHRNKL
jgi:hypothetical protein